MPDFFENLSISSISRVKDALAVRSLNNKPSPKASVEIKSSPPRPMAYRYKNNLIFTAVDRKFSLIHPVHLQHPALVGKDAKRAYPRNENWVVEFMQLVESFHVEVVVMVVTNQNQIDLSEFLHAASRRTVSFMSDVLRR